jgi:hypothetical protein
VTVAMYISIKSLDAKRTSFRKNTPQTAWLSATIAIRSLAGVAKWQTQRTQNPPRQLVRVRIPLPAPTQEYIRSI